VSAGATEAVEIVLTTGDRVGVGAGASVDVVLDSGRGDHPSGEAWRSEANDCSAPTTAIRSSSIRRLEAHAL